MSTVKDSWAVLLKLRPEFYKPHVCVLMKLIGLSRMTWHDDQVGLVSNSAYVDICNLSVRISVLPWCILYMLADHVISRKTSFLQTTYLLLYLCIIVPCSNHGLLASTFKVLIGLPLVILLARHERTGVRWRFLWRQTCELGRFPVRMPVGLRQMAWVQVIDEDFRCEVILKTWP